MRAIDSRRAEARKAQVLTIMTSASGREGVKLKGGEFNRPAIISESTRFLGQPRLTIPTLTVSCFGSGCKLCLGKNLGKNLGNN